MQALLLNDCTSYHVGSRAVTNSIIRLAEAAGIQITAFSAKPDTSELPPCDLVIVNGEGTFHHNAPRALLLHQLAGCFKKRGTKVVLINAVVQQMDVDFGIYDRLVTRESLSARELARRHPRLDIEVIPDLALCHPMPELPPKKRHGIMFIDSVSGQHTQILDRLAASQGCGAMRLCLWKNSFDELLEFMAGKELIVTGRFHGAVLAIMAETPFLAIPSNTWKTRGMLADLGLSTQYCADERALADALAGPPPPVARVSVRDITAKWQRFFASLTGHATEKMPPQEGSSTTGSLAPVIAPDVSCVLVGNGPSVLSGKGSVIDEFDEVIRFNHYTTKGLEAHTGTKTTIWSTFGKGMLPQEDQRPDKIIFVHGNSGKPAYTPRSLWRIPAAYYQTKREAIRAISRFPADRKIRLSPSSGFLVASWLLDQGIQKISLIGFDHFRKERSSQHHYWDPKAFGKPLEHDGEAEATLLAPWTAEGRVNYLA